MPPVVVEELPDNVVNFGTEPVLLPVFLPSTGSEKEIYRWKSLNDWVEENNK